jgi:ABC-type amino acid transport substrate-binding protein
MPTLTRRHALTLIGTTGAAIALAPSMAFTAPQTIVCNWDETFAPYSMKRDDAMTGILVDCLNELLGKRMGIRLEHRGYAWPEAQSLVSEGAGDCLCTNPTDARRQFCHFTEEPLVESLPSIFRAADSPRRNEIDAITTLEDLKGYRQVDYAGNGWAQETFPPSLPIVSADTLTQALEMIARGEADIFVGNGLAAMYAIRQAGLKDRLTARDLDVGQSSSFHFGLRTDYPDCDAFMERFVAVQDDAVAQGVIRKIILNYL